MPETVMINPALVTHPAEAAILGTLVLGYGELDITMVACAGDAMGLTMSLLDAVDQVNSEATRIEIVKRLSSKAFDGLNLSAEAKAAFAALHQCREARNTFTHCHYGYEHDSGLLYVKAHDLFAKDHGVPELPWRLLTVESLTRMAKYFEATRKLWLWLQLTIPSAKKGEKSAFDYPSMPDVPPRDAGASTYFTDRKAAAAETNSG